MALGIEMGRMNRKRGAAVGSAVLILLSLSSCSAFPSPQMQDIASVEDDLELDEIGDTVCDYWNRPTIIDSNPYFRFVGVDGSDNYETVIRRLEDLGFEVDRNGVEDDGTHLEGFNDIDVRVHQYTVPSSVKQVQPSGCDIPPDGLVTIAMFKY